MKKISSLLGGIAIVALIAGSFAFAYTQEQREAYQWAYNYGITTQPNIEAANLNGVVTRQAFSKMVVNYLENVVGIKQTASNSCKFSDESKITSDLRPYAKKTCAYNIMGTNGSAFNPMNPLTRAQLGTVLSRILRGDEYNNSGKRYYVYHLDMLKQNGIMNNTSNPQSHAKRGDVLIMLKRTYEKFGSNVYMNGNKAPTKSTNNSVKTTSNISTDNNSNNTPVVRKTDSNGFSYYDSYLDNPRLSNAMKEMKLRSTYCSNIFCQQVGDDGTYSNQKHYYWNDEEGTMTLIPGVYYVSDCAYYDKIYGSNSSSSYYVEDEDDDDDYISAVYDNSSVIYTSKDGTKYYYDDKFLSMLKDTAEKKGESDLADYLKIEAEYFKNGLDQLADLDDEDLLESMGIDVDDIDPDNMTKQEKQELIKKFKSALGKVIDENKSKNNKLLSDLKKVTKNIKNDKFGLKEKYDETKIFMEASNEFLDLYSESILDLIELALMKEDGDEDSEEAMAQAFGLIGIALAYQGTAQEYQAYLEEWAVNTLKSLGEEVDSNNKVQTISKDELKEIPGDGNETFVNNMRYNRPKADYKIIDNKGYYMEQTDICKITDENGNTYNEKAYSLGRYYEFTIDPSASVNTRGTSQGLKYVFEKENLIGVSEAKAANQLTTSFSEIGCHYVDLTVQDVNIGKQDKVRIWFNVKN